MHTIHHLTLKNKLLNLVYFILQHDISCPSTKLCNKMTSVHDVTRYQSATLLNIFKHLILIFSKNVNNFPQKRAPSQTSRSQGTYLTMANPIDSFFSRSVHVAEAHIKTKIHLRQSRHIHKFYKTNTVATARFTLLMTPPPGQEDWTSSATLGWSSRLENSISESSADSPIAAHSKTSSHSSIKTIQYSSIMERGYRIIPRCTCGELWVQQEFGSPWNVQVTLACDATSVSKHSRSLLDSLQQCKDPVSISFQ